MQRIQTLNYISKSKMRAILIAALCIGGVGAFQFWQKLEPPPPTTFALNALDAAHGSASTHDAVPNAYYQPNSNRNSGAETTPNVENAGGKYAHLQPLDLNTADSAALEALPGIGQVLAGRIIKYRYVRKGYSSVEDIKQVYGLKPEHYEKAAPYLFVGKASDYTANPPSTNAHLITAGQQAKQNPYQNPVPQKVDLNTADSAALERLPGLGPILSARIVKYRKSIGGFTSVEQIRNVYNLRETHYLKAAPYLYIEPRTAPKK